MKEIPIPRKDGTIHIVFVDDEDYDRVIAAGPWYIKPGKRTFYVARNVRGPTGRATQRLHRFILGAACEDKLVDHIDGNGLNNQRSNLRACTNSENMRNRRLHRNNTSGFKGVIWLERNQRWCAQIGASGKHYYIGLFNTPEEAHAAYCEAAARLHGKFARFA